MKKDQSTNVIKTLEEKWSSYRGTGVNASKDGDSLVLREGAVGGEFAVVKLINGGGTVSKMQVLEEIPTTSEFVAKQRFVKLVQELGFVLQPTKTIGGLLKII